MYYICIYLWNTLCTVPGNDNGVRGQQEDDQKATSPLAPGSERINSGMNQTRNYRRQVRHTHWESKQRKKKRGRRGGEEDRKKEIPNNTNNG